MKNFDKLISVSELFQMLDRPDVVIFDCRHDLSNPQFGTQAYAASHLPGARFAHVDKNLSAPVTGKNGRHPLPDPSVFMDWLGRQGVSNTTQVIGYDGAGGLYAARLWWMMRWVGHGRVAVLDGGWDAWVKAGHPVTKETVTPTLSRFTGKADASLVDADFVRKHLGQPDMLVIDARANDRFHGQNETIDPVAGHIPGAVNYFFRQNLDAQGLFKPGSELKAAFTQVIGATPSPKVVHQCGSGISACHNLLAMEIAGLAGSRLYGGSWSEWIADRTRPVATD
jgi:thiosulfate/3-mercaptopyruvate sulfurtransferase